MEDNELRKKIKRLDLHPDIMKRIMRYEKWIKEDIEQETKEVIQRTTDSLQKAGPKLSKDQLQLLKSDIQRGRDNEGKTFRDILIKGLGV